MHSKVETSVEKWTDRVKLTKKLDDVSRTISWETPTKKELENLYSLSWRRASL